MPMFTLKKHFRVKYDIAMVCVPFRKFMGAPVHPCFLRQCLLAKLKGVGRGPPPEAPKQTMRCIIQHKVAICQNNKILQRGYTTIPTEPTYELLGQCSLILEPRVHYT